MKHKWHYSLNKSFHIPVTVHGEDIYMCTWTDMVIQLHKSMVYNMLWTILLLLVEGGESKGRNYCRPFFTTLKSSKDVLTVLAHICVQGVTAIMRTCKTLIPISLYMTYSTFYMYVTSVCDHHLELCFCVILHTSQWEASMSHLQDLCTLVK